MKSLKVFCIIAFALAILLSFRVQTQSKVAGENNAFVPGPTTESSAKKIFLNNCARCHGVDGRGQTELGRLYDTPDMTDAGWQKSHSNKQMSNSIINGQGSMPAFGKKLSAKDIKELVRYIRLLKK